MSRPISRFTQPIASPYPGLRPFQPHEAPVFFGRDEHVADMLTILEDQRFLAVVGPSGGGKSSLVLAGLLPALERGALLTARSDDWRFVTLRPGDAPYRRLAAAVHEYLPRTAEGEPAASGFHDGDVPLTELVLRSNPRGFVQTLHDAAVPEKTNVLLLVDQFEELFRFRTPEQSGTAGQAAERRNDAADFVQLLLATARQVQRPVYVLLTMRSDFLGECDMFDDLPQAINKGQYLAPRLNARQLEQAIVRPPELPQFAGRVQPEVVQRIVNDIGTARDELPIVQHALHRAWTAAIARAPNIAPTPRYPGERVRERGTAANADAIPPPLPTAPAAPPPAPTPRTTLTLDDYHGVGGIQDALSREADRALSECRAASLERVAEWVFRGLVQRGISGQHVRRSATIKQLADEAGATPEQVIAVVEPFRRVDRSFLTSSPPALEQLDPHTPIDISHESLIRQWKTLRDDWLPKEDVAADRYRRLVKAEGDFRRGDGDLLSKIELKRLRDWWQHEQPNPAWARRYEACGPDSVAGDTFGHVAGYLEQSWRHHRMTVIVSWSLAGALGRKSSSNFSNRRIRHQMPRPTICRHRSDCTRYAPWPPWENRRSAIWWTSSEMAKHRQPIVRMSSSRCVRHRTRQSKNSRTERLLPRSKRIGARSPATRLSRCTWAMRAWPLECAS
ncbi:MAG: hypothetical protein NTY19_52215 [Planctomycetota bacterium]|nr:hypothetical protein [Planctomycetota bacterium]